MPFILLTNDDGIESPGLAAMQEALLSLGEVAVIAPDHSWSASGHTKTMHKPLRVGPGRLFNGAQGLMTNGAPSDCVALAVLGVLPKRPQLVVSGINKGSNLGEDVTYSGTVAAALEGAVSGIPSLAVSMDGWERWDFAVAARYGAQVAAEVLRHGLPAGNLLNINVPAGETRGVRVTRLGRRMYRDALIERTDPRGEKYYWIGGDPPVGVLDEGTDVWAVANGYVSVCPLTLDLTDHRLLEQLKAWNLQEG